MWRSAAALLVGAALVTTPVPGQAAGPWRACTEKNLRGLDCAQVVVPKDYQDPGKGTFTLSVVRARSTGTPTQRIGTLFFNPGGPGVSGVDVAPSVVEALPPQVRARFDLVTWDPRGVARSSGLQCEGGSYTLPDAGPVDWAAVSEQMRTSARAANEACAAKYPDVVPFIGTSNTARDLDRLRVFVGDRRLTYWGTSYGTRIGAVYAHLFPDNVRAMMLSSPVDPNATWTEFALGSGVAPDNAVGFFFEVRPAAQKRYNRVIKQLTERALRLPSGAVVNHWNIQAVVATSMSSISGYPTVASLLRTTDTALNGTGKARRAAREALDRQPWLERYPINGGATPVIGCLDLPQRFTAAQQDALAARLRGQAPVFGWGQAQALYYCEGLSGIDPIPTDRVNTRTPMLIVGSTRDALTSYEWVTSMARTFRNSRVMTLVGTPHTPVYTSGSACLDNAATRYLVDRQRPRVDLSCRSVVPSDSPNA